MNEAPKPGPAPRAPAPEWPKTVRSTIQPTVDLQVEEAEWTDLHRMGLLLPGHDGTPPIGD